jgi:hypothetical protein
VIQGEWQVNEKFVGCTLRRVMLLDDIIDMSNGGAHEERENER